MTIKDPVKLYMTREVVTLRPKDPMQKARTCFETSGFHHIPVVQDGKLVGILSKTDYTKLLHGFTLFHTRSSRSYNEAVFRSILVGEVMSKPVVTVKAEDKLELAAAIFLENLFHALPVVDSEGRLEGILTTHDLIKHVFSQPVMLQEGSSPD